VDFGIFRIFDGGFDLQRRESPEIELLSKISISLGVKSESKYRFLGGNTKKEK